MLNAREIEQENVRLAAVHLPLLFALQNVMNLVWWGFLQNGQETPQWSKHQHLGFFVVF